MIIMVYAMKVAFHEGFVFMSRRLVSKICSGHLCCSFCLQLFWKNCLRNYQTESSKENIILCPFHHHLQIGMDRTNVPGHMAWLGHLSSFSNSTKRCSIVAEWFHGLIKRLQTNGLVLDSVFLLASICLSVFSIHLIQLHICKVCFLFRHFQFWFHVPVAYLLPCAWYQVCQYTWLERSHLPGQGLSQTLSIGLQYPSSTAMISYTIGLQKLSANWQ